MKQLIYIKTRNQVAWLLVLLICIVSSCEYGKHIPTDKTILWQNRVLVNGKFTTDDNVEFLNQLNAGIAQLPNTALFGLDLETANLGYRMPRPKLFYYNLFYKKIAVKKDSTLLKNNLAQLPVLYDSNKKNFSKKVLQAICDNNGFFYAKVKDSVVQMPDKKTLVYYNVQPGKNFVYNKISFKVKDAVIDSLLMATRDLSIIQPKRPITKTGLDAECKRITSFLVENGYFSFRQSGVIPSIDTTNQQLVQNFDNPFEQMAILLDTATIKKIPSANVLFTISDSINNIKVQRYFVNKVRVKINNGTDVKSKLFATFLLDDIEFLNTNTFLQPKILANQILIKKGELFSTKKVDATLNRLRSLSALQNIKVDFAPNDTNATVDCTFELTLNNYYNTSWDIEGSQGKGYDLGAELKYTLQNNNVFKKSYQLINAGQVGAQSNINRGSGGQLLQLWLLNYGVSTDLKIPHFLAPSFITKNTKDKTPQTIIGASFNSYQRPSAFTQISVNGNLTYSWQQNNSTSWKVTPAFITIVATPNINADFNANNLATNPIFKQQLQPYTIVGSRVNFQYTNKKSYYQPTYSFTRLNVEKTGSLLNLILKNKNIAEYLQLDAEYKIYKNHRKKTWVNRIFGYTGIPIYQKTLPYIKLQSIGGPISLRGWRANELGPGAAVDTTKNITRVLTNNGDIKLELNSELRFPIVNLFGNAVKVEGATFVDAGNIWRFSDTTNNGVAQFSFKKIPKDIAVNSGFGLRFNLSFLILRADYGIPIYQPYLPEAARWGFSSKKSTQGLQRLGAWQVGINYPF